MKKIPGTFWVAIAAILWGTDALVRYPLSKIFSATDLVWLEHMTGLLFIVPWVLYRHRKKIFNLKFKEWIAIAFFGIGGSALADIFYTASLQFVGTAVSILIIKLQPLFVLWTAYFFLGEKPKKNLFPWALIALICVILLSFPDLHFDFINKGMNNYTRGVLYAFVAMLLWSLSTVAGKYFLYRHPASVAVFWRWASAAIALGIISHYFDSTPIAWGTVFSSQALPYLLYLGSVAGVIAMGIYYVGLKSIPASQATFVELLYPLTGVVLNALILDAKLNEIQILSTVLLLISLILIITPRQSATTK